jgi:excinuclease ABC subunit A
MDKPDADLIEGITPAIAIQQKAATKNPRSTVATVTEIHDFLRVLFARIGTIHCLKCGQPVRRDTIDSIIASLSRLPARSPLLISFSWPLEKGLALLKKEGFFRIIQDGRVLELEKARLPKKGAVDVFVDELAPDPEERERLADSLETAFKKGDGRAKVRARDGRVFLFSDKLECKTDWTVYEEPFPNLFSFNSPQGACPECHGFGDLAVLDEEKIIPDQSLSLEAGAVEPWTKPVSHWWMKELLRQARRKGIPTNTPYHSLGSEEKRFVMEGGGAYQGVRGFFDWLQTKKYKVQVRVFLSRYRKYVSCPACRGTRLNQRALSVKIDGRSIGEVARMTVREASAFFRSLKLTPYETQVAEKLVVEIQNRLKFLLEVGLDYITLDRMTFTLSGGEAQRINLAAALSASLVGTLFVLDEPSIGLHARDNHRLIEILRSLKDLGNTVLVVEHDPEIIRSAEHLIDLGPKAGEAGGEVLYSGPMEEFLRRPGSLTAQYLRNEKRIGLPESRRRGAGYLEIKDAHKHNLKHLDVKIPLGTLTCITGVSGSGKSTLLHDVLYLGWTGEAGNGFREIRGRELVDKVIMVDQSPLSTSPRSIPATYTKAMDGIRELFSDTREARAMGFRPGFFSFNTAGGRCEECKGAGQQIVEMQFLSDVVLTCDVCKGKRFRSDVLEVKYRGRNIDDVLKMSISQALSFFSQRPDIRKRLFPLEEVGLGYLRLGQPTTTLSGGELQRIKLAYHLVHERERRILYLFDEPTIGLHPEDVAVLLGCFQRLVSEGHTVAVIEHNLDVVKCADYVIDLGPEGGEAGGEVVASGTPEEVVKARNSITARFLRPYLEGASGCSPKKS